MVKYTQSIVHGLVFGHVYFETLAELKQYVTAQFRAYQKQTQSADSTLDNVYQAGFENRGVFDEDFQRFFEQDITPVFVAKESYSPYQVVPDDLVKIIDHFMA